MEEGNHPAFVPSEKQRKVIGEVYGDLKDFLIARQKKYYLLGNRTPQKFWDDEEKKFVSYSPPKDVTENDWQANIVMGLTRNAVLSQVAKAGMRVPEAKIQSYGQDGFVDDDRSRIWQNVYRWSLRREGADRLQQFISLGNFIRGNVCLYEGFEDKEIELDIITDTDPETGEVKTEKKKEQRWGPRRQIVPLNEILFPNYFTNDIQDQPKVIWRQTVPYDVAKAEFGGYKNWNSVVPGNYNVAYEDDSFFYSRNQLGRKHVDIVRWYGNPWKGGKDRYRVCVQGVLLLDIPLPFNHKRLPFSWGRNEPFADKFMLGMGVPFKMMDSQDTGDALLNMLLDKNLLSMQKPIMTDDPDPEARTYLSPGSIMQFTRGSTWSPLPLEGVTASEMGLYQTVVQQAKEFSGAFGGSLAGSPRGGKVTARQAVMMEEETKRLLGISMTNLEFVERDLCILRLSNLQQFLPSSGKSIDTSNADLADGRKGRFVAFFAETMKKANEMELRDHTLSTIELAGEKAGQPTTAVAVGPDWFDLVERLEAETVPESAYNASRSIEQAMAMEDYATLRQDPLIDPEENLRELLKVKGKDPERLIKKQAPQPVPPGQQGPPGIPGGPPAGPPGPITAQAAGKGQTKSLSAVMGV